MHSGSEVVTAATMPPVGRKVMALRVISERSTIVAVFAFVLQAAGPVAPEALACPSSACVGIDPRGIGLDRKGHR